ncbi:MAG: ROK family protein [Bacillota bacterium]|nr:ROK family protein [Bacillota bacterium]
MMDKNILAIDIGGSKLLVGIINKQGKVLVSRKQMFHNPNQNSVLQAIITQTSKLKEEGYEFNLIGVSIPGLADPITGVWLYACFSKISNFPLAQILSERFMCPVFIENDANICAYGEKMFGHAKNVSNFIWVTVSNGIGSGVFLDNHIFYGYIGNAGEIGHVNVEENGYTCSCGNKGCLEAQAAGPAIVRRYREKVLSASENITAKEIADLAKNGYSPAIEIYGETGRYLGKAIAAAVNILNVPLVVLGGGVSMDFQLFAGELRDTINKYVYKTANPNLEIKHTALGYEASLIGAAAYAIYRTSKEKSDNK